MLFSTFVDIFLYSFAVQSFEEWPCLLHSYCPPWCTSTSSAVYCAFFIPSCSCCLAVLAVSLGHFLGQSNILNRNDATKVIWSFLFPGSLDDVFHPSKVFSRMERVDVVRALPGQRHLPLPLQYGILRPFKLPPDVREQTSGHNHSPVVDLLRHTSSHRPRHTDAVILRLRSDSSLFPQRQWRV